MSGILYLSSILIANILVHLFGIVEFMGIVFPAGSVVIGLTFTFRDIVQRKYGKWKCWLWMILATVITILFNVKLAIASGSAFLISEAVDWLIYTAVKGDFIKRIFFSNIFGIPLDSIIFVTLAFGWNFPAVFGQTIIKILSSFIVIPFLYIKEGAFLKQKEI